MRFTLNTTLKQVSSVPTCNSHGYKATLQFHLAITAEEATNPPLLLTSVICIYIETEIFIVFKRHVPFKSGQLQSQLKAAGCVRPVPESSSRF